MKKQNYSFTITIFFIQFIFLINIAIIRLDLLEAPVIIVNFMYDYINQKYFKAYHLEGRIKLI